MEKKGPFQEIEIRKPEIIGEFAIVKKFSAMVADSEDLAVYNAIIDAAKKAGINSLLLMDRRFVLNALEVAIKRQEMLDSCSEAPTIEAEPVRHATLIEGVWDEVYCQWGTCSKCGADNLGHARYCNECGAKMDLEV